MVGPDEGLLLSARDDVLRRVRAALAGAPPAPPVARGYRSRGALPPGHPDLLDLLQERLVDYRAVVHRTDEAGLAAAVAGAVAGARLVVPAGLPPAWVAGLAVTVDAAPGSDGLDAPALDRLDGVVTGCRVAVAETGTVVLDAAPDQGRRALSLVPDLHVCVVHAAQVVGTVPEAVARLDPTRPLTWVSGPSATSDIELVRVEGVHGPRRLHVVLVGPVQSAATGAAPSRSDRHRQEAPVTEPDESSSTRDARDGDGDPQHDPAAIGEQRLQAQDGDGGATPSAQDVAEPDTGADLPPGT